MYTVAEQSTSTIDLYRYDLKGCIKGGSSHVDPTFDEQCGHHRPLGHATAAREPSNKCFVGHGVNRYLPLAPKMLYAARPVECISTVTARIFLFIMKTTWIICTNGYDSLKLYIRYSKLALKAVVRTYCCDASSRHNLYYCLNTNWELT